MSRKLRGSGRADELGQVMLDWDVTGKFLEEIEKKSVQAEEKASEIVQEEVSVEKYLEQGHETVLLEANLGVSGLDVGAHDDNGAIATEGADESMVDTVILRAQQALGKEQFEDLVLRLNRAAYFDEVDAVMAKFRDEAKKFSQIDANDLWDAVIRQAKNERFGLVKEQIKFYYSVSLDDLKRILRSGFLARKNDESSPLKSDVKFSMDRLEPRGWRSGFADERGADSVEVTMVFDGGLIDEETFVALGMNPVVNAVDWRGCCLGLVKADAVDNVDLTRVLRQCGARDLPVYLEKDSTGGIDWSKTMFDAKSLREARAEYMEKMAEQRKIEEQVFTKIDHNLIDRNVQKFARRLDLGDIDDLYEEHEESFAQGEKVQDALGELARYFADVLDLEKYPSVEVYRDEKDRSLGYLQTEKKKMRIQVNLAQVAGDFAEAARVISHEIWRYRQLQIKDGKMEGGSMMSSGKMPLKEIYQINFENYISLKLDFGAAKKQFVEAEAERFSQACEGRFRKVELERQKLPRRVQRTAKKVREKINEVKKMRESHDG